MTSNTREAREVWNDWAEQHGRRAALVGESPDAVAATAYQEDARVRFLRGYRAVRGAMLPYLRGRVYS